MTYLSDDNSSTNSSTFSTSSEFSTNTLVDTGKDQSVVRKSRGEKSGGKRIKKERAEAELGVGKGLPIEWRYPLIAEIEATFGSLSLSGSSDRNTPPFLSQCLSEYTLDPLTGKTDQTRVRQVKNFAHRQKLLSIKDPARFEQSKLNLKKFAKRTPKVSFQLPTSESTTTTYANTPLSSPRSASNAPSSNFPSSPPLVTTKDENETMTRYTTRAVEAAMNSSRKDWPKPTKGKLFISI